MAVKGVQVVVPADGTEVPVVDEDGDHIMGNDLSFRNTGTVDLKVGGPGSCVYPLAADPDSAGFGEAVGASLGTEDMMYVKIASGAVAGEITALKTR